LRNPEVRLPLNHPNRRTQFQRRRKLHRPNQLLEIHNLKLRNPHLREPNQPKRRRRVLGSP